MRCLSFLLTTVLLVCVSSSLRATIIHVPTDSTTIQAGINGAVHGDTVVVHPGTYVENIDFIGKAIAVIGADGPDSTIIDGNQAGSVVTFGSGELTNSILEGFTITDGSGTYLDSYWGYGGGGIYCEGSAPTIQYNNITDNAANNGGGIALLLGSHATIRHNSIFGNSANTIPGRVGGGGGIVAGWSSNPQISYNDIYNNYSNVAGGGMACGFECDPQIKNNTIRDNVANVYGGGIQTYSFTTGTIENNTIMGNSSNGNNGAGGISCRDGSTPMIANNLIFDNSAATYGGGIRCFEEASPTIVNNLIYHNKADISGGGIECDKGASATMTNTILWNNDAPAGTEIWIGPRTGFAAALTISYSDVEGGMASVHVEPGSNLNWGAGMIDEDPLFRSPGAVDFHLMATACGDALDSPCIDTGDLFVTDLLLDCSHGLGAMRSDVGPYGGQGAGPPLTIETADSTLPRLPRLFQNYPNPFNPVTHIRFSLLNPAPVRLALYNLAGQCIATLLEGPFLTGQHEVTWDGKDAKGKSVASGVYLYRLETSEFMQTRKMMLIR